jgi:excisionase family DNA binding protein
MPEQLLIPQAEACRRLGISRPTLVAEIEAGRLRYVLVGKRRKFKPSDLESYIERQGRGCDGSEVWSHNAKVHTTTTKISRLKVIDFDEALRLTIGKQRRS